MLQGFGLEVSFFKTLSVVTILAFTIAIVAKDVSANDGPVLMLAQGQLRGIRSIDGGCESFNNIPYASPPDDTRRFKGPPAAKPWEGTRDAADDTVRCLSRQGRLVSGSEDCLYLNIHRPAGITGRNLLPVLVWIHGGGFNGGSASSHFYGPSNLIKHGIILVTFSYRLGPLGFLCFEDKKIPGNAGLKDMVAALRWIRDNVIAFGGDPNSVTIGGQGSGGAAVEYLMISPMADGLFHKAISQSGSAVHPWAFHDDAHRRAAFLARYLKKDVIDTKNISEILLKALPKDLVRATEFMDQFPYFNFAPCLENEINNEERFLYDNPMNIIRAGKMKYVPFLAGYNNKEAYIFAPYILNNNIIDTIQTKFYELLPIELKFQNGQYLMQEANLLKREYFRNSDNIFDDLLTYQTDALFVYHKYKSMKMLAKHSDRPAYFYEFSYDGPLGYNNLNNIEKSGASHGDEMAYLFVQEGRNQTLDQEDQITRDRLILMWTNFVKYGDPTPTISDVVPLKWEPTSKEQISYLQIGNGLAMKTFSAFNRMRLWDEIYDKS